MSRLGKIPIIIPSGVKLELALPQVKVTGPKGTVVEHIPNCVTINQTDGVLTVSVANSKIRSERAMWGLARQLLAKAVQGVTDGFQKKLELSGVGFKAQLDGKDLVLNIGFSHPVRFVVPSGIVVTVEKNIISVSGASSQQVGQVAAEIRALKKPEPYKGKGIKYSDEIIRRKAGKVVKAAGAK